MIVHTQPQNDRTDSVLKDELVVVERPVSDLGEIGEELLFAVHTLRRPSHPRRCDRSEFKPRPLDPIDAGQAVDTSCARQLTAFQSYAGFSGVPIHRFDRQRRGHALSVTTEAVSPCSDSVQQNVVA